LWLHSLKVVQLLRSAACLHTNQSPSYLNHLVRSEVLIAAMMKTEDFYNATYCRLVSMVTEDEGTTLLQYVGEYLPVGMAPHRRKVEPPIRVQIIKFNHSLLQRLRRQQHLTW